jgi:hypothetical protein
VNTFDLVAVLCGAVGAGSLIRAYIHHRTRVGAERERSRRAQARAAGLARLTGRHDSILIEEQDADGHRVFELRARPEAPRTRDTEAV